MTLPWQTAATQIRYGGYVPLADIQPPSDGRCPRTLDEKLRPLWLGLHLIRGVPLPQDMAEDPLTMYCRTAEAWVEVPLVVAGLNGSAVIVPVLLGCLPKPEINIIAEDKWLVPQAADAARIALRLAGKDQYGFLLLPRFVPDSLPRIEGSSLGLPLAVAALRLSTGKSLPADIMMTGKVDEQGNVLNVGHLSEKRACCIRNKDYPARLFLYPANNSIDKAPLPESLPVSRLEDADTLLDLAETDGVAGIAVRLAQWRDNPAEFFSWLNSCSLTETAQICLLELAEKQAWCVICSDEARSAALEALKPYWKKITHSGKLRQLLTKLFPFDKVKNLPSSPGLQALVEHCKTLDNHHGLCSTPWSNLSDRCKKERRENSNADLVEDLTTKLRDMIKSLHNAFRFQPSDIPQDWLDDVAYYSRGTDTNIGKCYGFLTHHYAFCGMYDEALACAASSLHHFTGAAERKRRHIDRVYLFLDSGRPDDARRELLKILDADAADDALAEQVARQDDAYVHAAFVRLCQSLPHEMMGYPVEKILSDSARKEHPWQLWAYNCGRVLVQHNQTLALRCLEFSRDTCLADSNSTTIPPMTLMPLAVLHTAHLTPPTEILQATKEVLHNIQRHCADGTLYEPHFHPLLELPTSAAVLEEVAAHTARYFPFNYH